MQRAGYLHKRLEIRLSTSLAHLLVQLIFSTRQLQSFYNMYFSAARTAAHIAPTLGQFLDSWLPLHGTRSKMSLRTKTDEFLYADYPTLRSP
jgi:hypothetical protein